MSHFRFEEPTDTVTMPRPAGYVDPLTVRAEGEGRVTRAYGAASSLPAGAADRGADLFGPKTVSGTVLKQSPHQIAGEPFAIELEVGDVLIVHEHWSLMGRGATILEAEADLMRHARELAPFYVREPLASLDYEAYRLQEFLLRVI